MEAQKSQADNSASTPSTHRRRDCFSLHHGALSPGTDGIKATTVVAPTSTVIHNGKLMGGTS